jgi:(p)ppGpp synthase/HD superfamily hydrolase
MNEYTDHSIGDPNSDKFSHSLSKAPIALFYPMRSGSKCPEIEIGKSNHEHNAPFESCRVPLVNDALCMAKAAHKGQYRDSGEKYISHPVAVARLYSHVSSGDTIGLAVSLIHDVQEDSNISLCDIQRFFGRHGKEISTMVGALSKMPYSLFSSRKDRLSEYYDRFFDASFIDKRIPLIRVLDRLHNIKTIDVLEPKRALRILKETEEVLVPFFMFLNLPLTRKLDQACKQKRRKLRSLAMSQE